MSFTIQIQGPIWFKRLLHLFNLFESSPVFINVQELALRCPCENYCDAFWTCPRGRTLMGQSWLGYVDKSIGAARAFARPAKTVTVQYRRVVLPGRGRG